MRSLKFSSISGTLLEVRRSFKGFSKSFQDVSVDFQHARFKGVKGRLWGF